MRYASKTEEKDVIGTPSLRFTTAAGIASVFTAVVGAALPVLDKLDALKVTENVKIAMLGLVGAGVVGYAIASAGDVLARAYASAHVIPAAVTSGEGETKKTDPIPVAKYMVDKLVAEAELIRPGLERMLTTSSSHTRHVIALDGAHLNVKTRLHDDCEVLALAWDDGNPEALQYLTAHEGEAPSWLTKRELEVVA